MRAMMLSGRFSKPVKPPKPGHGRERRVLCFMP